MTKDQNQNPIKTLFETCDINTETKLIVIDSLYSTNANKSIGATSDIAEAIDHYFKKNPSPNFEAFIEKPSSNPDLLHLFDGKYGKTGVRKQSSLISKFFYYHTDLNFPIYDKFLREMLYKFF